MSPLFREAGLVDEEGLPIYPKTLQEVAEYGQIIREKTGKAGLVFPASETYGGWLFTNIAWNFGCVGENALEYQDEDGRWVCNFTSDECVAAMGVHPRPALEVQHPQCRRDHDRLGGRAFSAGHGRSGDELRGG